MFISGRKLIAARGTQFREDGRYSENTVELPLGLRAMNALMILHNLTAFVVA
jgi:hypothetical protein